MLRTETVEKGTLDLIKIVMTDEKFGSFNLVGGTALALKIGHRRSIDIDLFTTTDFDSREISHHLSTIYNATRVQTITNGVFCFVNGIKLDVLAHKYPLLEEIEIVEGIRLVSLKDIGAMKLNAIYGNGSRLKDFVDVYALLELFPLQELLEASEKKYPENIVRSTKNSLIYFEDIDFTVPIDYIGQEIKWATIAERLKKAFHNPYINFGIPEVTKKLMQQIKSNTKGKNKGPKL